MTDLAEKYPAVWHRIFRQYQILLGELNQEYRRSRPGCPEDDFRRRILDELSAQMSLIFVKDDIDHAELCEFIYVREEDGIKSDIAFIYFSSAYALASELAVKRWAIDLGWQLQCKAHFYCALAISTNRKEEIFNASVVGEYVGSVSSKGGIGKGNSFKKYRMRAQEIFCSRKWGSLGSAEEEIFKKMEIEFPKKKNNRGEDEDNYKRSSIVTWLKELPEEVMDEQIPGYKVARERSKAAARKKET